MITTEEEIRSVYQATHPRAMAALAALNQERNRVDIESVNFKNGVAEEVHFVVILEGQRASIVIGAVPDPICDDFPRIIEWARKQAKQVAEQLSEVSA